MPLEITRPTVSQVAMLLEALSAEASRFLAPPTVADVTARWGVNLLLFLGTVDGQPAALFGVDDPTFDDAGRPIDGTTLIFILPAYRGHLSFALTRLGLERADAWGFRRLWTWCKGENFPVQVLVQRCGFVPCSPYPGPAPDDTRLFVWNAPTKG